jgi:hypothetical protein
MDRIVSEFVPDLKALQLTERFCPRKDSNDPKIMALIKNGAYGVTSAAVPGANPRQIPGLGGRYVTGKVPDWMEEIRHEQKELLEIRKPENPNEIWGLDMMTDDMNFLDIRLNNRIEQTTADSVFLNGYAINNNGVKFTFDAGVAPRYRIYMGNTVPSDMIATPWRSKSDNYLWTAASTCTPIDDITNLINYAGSNLGLTVKGMTLNSYTGGLFSGATSVKSVINAVLARVGMTLGVKPILNLVGGLETLEVNTDDRIYNMESYIVSDAAIGASTITVRDSAELAVTNSDYFVGRNYLGREELLKVHASTPINTTTPGAHIITLAAVTTLAYTAQDRVTFGKKFVPDGYIAFEVQKQVGGERANWVSIPSMIGKPNGKATPGAYNWSYVREANRPPLYVVSGRGITGAPVIYTSGGWIIMKVKA